MARILLSLVFFISASLTIDAQTIASAGSGFWDQTTTWTGGVVPSSSNSSQVNILTGHTVRVRDVRSANAIVMANSSTSRIVIESAGRLDLFGDLALGTSLDRGRIEIAGILQFEDGSSVSNDDPARLIVQDGGMYRLNYSTDGIIYNGDFQEGSTIAFTGYGATGANAPTLIGGPGSTIFHHVEWNCAQTSDIVAEDLFTTINGNFTINSTSLSPDVYFLVLAQNSDLNLFIGGNLSVNGPSVVYFSGPGSNINSSTFVQGNTSVALNSTSYPFVIGGGTGISDLTISGDLSLTTGGQITIQEAAGGTSTLTALGNVTVSAGRILSSTNAGSTGTIVFDGDVVHTYTYTSATPIATKVSFDVTSGDALYLGTSPLQGSGSLFVRDGATLGVGSLTATGALQTGNVVGSNVRLTGGTSTRLYESGSTIRYNGIGPQFMAATHPSASGVRTEIANTSGVSLVGNATIGGELELIDLASSSNLAVFNTTNAYTLTLNGPFTPHDNSLVLKSTSTFSSIAINGSGPFGTLVTSGGPSLNNLTINRSGEVVTLGSDLIIQGTFTHTNGILDFPGRSLTLRGAYSAGGVFVTDASSTLIVENTGTITGSIPIVGTIGTLTLNRASTTLNANATIATRLRVLQGTLSGNINMNAAGGATLERGNGTFTATLGIDATNGYNLEYSNSTALGSTGNEIESPIINFTMTGAGGITLSEDMDINGQLWIQNGTLTTGSHNISLGGNFRSDGGNTVFTGSTITFDGNTTLQGLTSINFANIAVASTGTLNWGSVICNVFGNITHTAGGTMTAGTGTVRFAGTTTITSNSLNTPRFNNLQINGSSSLSLVCSGTCNAEPNQFSIEVKGAWTSNISGSTFNPGSGPTTSRVIMNGTTAQTISMLPAQAFSTLELGGTSSITLSQALTTTNDLVIGVGTTLNTSGANYGLLLGDDFIVNGTFVPNLGVVTFNGSSNQSINQVAGTPAPLSLYTLVINKGGGNFTNEMDVNLINSLTIVSATAFDLDGPTDTDVFTLVSTQTKTAIVNPVNPLATFTGTVHAQRYMDGEGKIYRYISSPVGPVGTPSVTNFGPAVFDLQGEISITGTFTGDSFHGPCVGCAPCTGCSASSLQSMFAYNETLTAQTITNRYIDFPATSNTEQMVPGKGYAVFVRKDATPTVIDLRGRLNSGTIVLPVTYSGATADDGWNLVGNPYASPIDWGDQTQGSVFNGVTWTRTNIGTTIYTTDNGSGGVFATYDFTTGLGTNNGTRYIATGQGFWVRTTAGSPALSVTESAKAFQQPEFFRVEEPANLLRVSLSKGQISDEAIILFGFPGATSAYDENIDSRKLSNSTAVDFYTLSADNAKLTINTESQQICGKEIKLGMLNATAGAHRLNFNSIDSFTEPLNIYIQDQFTGTSKLITPADNYYDFQVTSDVNSKGENRFKLIFSSITLDSGIDVVSSDAVCSGTNATITLSSSQSGVGYTAMLQGNTVSDLVIGDGSGLSITVPKDKLVAGTNQIVVKASANSCGPISVNLTEAATVDVQNFPVINGVTNAANCGPGQVKIKANTNASGAIYKWYESVDAAAPIPGATGPEFTTPFLNKTKTYYASATTSAGCEGEKVAVEATIVNFDPVEVTEENGALKSSYPNGNQWYLNGTAIPGATGQVIVPVQSGSYKVTTTMSGCSTTSMEKIFAVTAIGDEVLPRHMSIYPNPTSGQISLEVNTDNPVQARIVSVLGIVLREELNDSGSTKKKLNFDIQDQADGLYLLKVQDGETTYSTRIVKKK